MFEKMKLQKKIKDYKQKIADTEQKRVRSQAALVEAILLQKTPSDSDVEYFNTYSVQIDNLRDELHKLQKEFDEMNANTGK